MRPQVRITRKAQRRQKHSEATVRELPTRRQSTQALIREAEEMVERLQHIARSDDA